LIKIIAGHVKEYRPASGNFDQWYQRLGIESDLVGLTTTDRRTHILKYAIEELEETQRLILSRVAAFSDPVNYRTLSIFNPYLPHKPLLPKLPPLPQTRSSPFGTPQLAWLKYQRSKAKIIEQQERLDAEIQRQEAIDAKVAEDMASVQAALEATEENVKKERRLILEIFEKSYQSSKEYLDGVTAFHAILTELEDRGLLQWDRENDSYDLHPVIRGYALSLLPREERVKTFGKIRDHFASIPTMSDEQVNEISDLTDMVDAYRALVSTGETDYAAEYYKERLSSILRRLHVPHLIVELLKPLFLNWYEAYPPLNNVTTQSHVINDLAVSLKATGQIDSALTLFSLNLRSEHAAKRWDKYTDISNYCGALLERNHIADSFRGREFAAEIIDQENISWSFADFLDQYTLSGQWAKVQQCYSLCIERSKPSNYTKQFECRVAYLYAVMQVCQAQATNETLLAALKTIEQNQEVRYKAPLFRWWAEYHLINNRTKEARQCIRESINLAQQGGYSAAVYFSILALVEALQGNGREAEQQLKRALSAPQLAEGEKADVYANAAQIYLVLQDTGKAQDYALRAYKYAWADGEPYIRFWPLNKAKDVLDALHLPYPNLPSFDPTMLNKIPYEDAIRKAYIEQGNLVNLTKEPKKQIAFEMVKFTWVQVGTAAFFGVDDDNLINQVAHKLSSLSYIPTPIRFSRMGDDVPEPSTFQIEIERQRFDDIVFTFDELRILDKVFVIVYVESFNANKEKVYAYINIRTDRLKRFFDQGETDHLFNIADYATIISTGYDKFTLEDRQKLQRDYLFGEHSLNVRIFPPLSKVT
jgi:hypothetical protein